MTTRSAPLSVSEQKILVLFHKQMLIYHRMWKLFADAAVQAAKDGDMSQWSEEMHDAKTAKRMCQAFAYRLHRHMYDLGLTRVIPRNPF